MRRLTGLAIAVALSACAPPSPDRDSVTPKMENPVTWFEIPVADMDRAVAFYTHVFGISLERTDIDGYEMALFPAADGAAGASGALAKGDVYVPSRHGPILYFRVPAIEPVLVRAVARGGTILYPRKAIGDLGFVAEFADSEGNRIALSEPPATG